MNRPHRIPRLVQQSHTRGAPVYEGDAYAERELCELTPWTRRSMLDGPDNKLGHSRDLAALNAAVGAVPPVTGPDLQSIQTLFRANACAGANTHVATVDLGLSFGVDQIGAGPLRQANVFARVLWGSGDANFEAFVDFHQGTQFSVAASFVEIGASFSAVVDDGVAFRSVRISAGVAWGTRPGKCAPTFTFPPTVIGDAASAIFPVPPFAYALQLFASTAAFYLAGGSTTRILAGPAGTDTLLTLYDGPDLKEGLFTEGVRLGGMGRGVLITNSSGAPVTVTPTFALNL